MIRSIVVALSVTEGVAAQPEPDLVAPLPIPLSEIMSRAAMEDAVLTQADVLLSRTAVFDAIENDLLNLERAIAERLVSLRGSLAAAASREAISEVEREWVDIDEVTQLSRRPCPATSARPAGQNPARSIGHDLSVHSCSSWFALDFCAVWMKI